MKNVDLRQVIEMLDLVSDSIDPDLVDHQQAVAGLCRSYGPRIGIDGGDDLEVLVLGAGLHDVGKLAQGLRHVIHKITRLTADEWHAIQRHTTIGVAYLAPLGLDPRIVEVVRHHHENWGGDGYPDHLAGKQIPLFARVVRLADSWHALTTQDRPWRPKVDAMRALEIMQRDAALYDPELLPEFMSMIMESPSCAAN